MERNWFEILDAVSQATRSSGHKMGAGGWLQSSVLTGTQSRIIEHCAAVNTSAGHSFKAKGDSPEAAARAALKKAHRWLSERASQYARAADLIDELVPDLDKTQSEEQRSDASPEVDPSE